MNSLKSRARRAGFLYFFLGITAPVGLMIVPGRLIVSGDAAATAERIRSSEWLFRVGIASELLAQTIAIFAVFALYRLFRDVNETHARLLLILGALVSVPVAFANVINQLAALTLIQSPAFLSVFDQEQREALAYLFLRLHTIGITVVSIFWGMWLMPFGLLVLRSGFIPGIFGGLLIVAGFGYLASATTTILWPQLAGTVESIAGILVVGEVPIIFWLLIWGARERPSHTA